MKVSANNVIKKIIKTICCIIPIKKYRKILRRNLYNFMLKKYPNLSHNEIILYKKDGRIIKNPSIPNLKIYFLGSNSKVILYEPICFKSESSFVLTDNNVISIEATEHGIFNFNIKTMTARSEIHIGKNFSCNGATVYFDVPEQKIFIGNDCMFAFDIEIWPDDGHAILDKTTLKPINYSNPETIIGNHVWIAREVALLKNTRIPDNCVIGMRTVVTKPFSVPNCIIAGIPAKVIKEGITWDRDNTYYYNKKRFSKKIS